MPFPPGSDGGHRALRKGLYSRLCDRLFLVDGAAANAYGAGHLTVAPERDATVEDDDPAVVGRVDAEERLFGLSHTGEILSGHLERDRGEGLVYGDVDATEPGLFHPRKGLEVPPVVYDRYVHRLPELLGLLLRRGDDLPRLFERDRRGDGRRHGGASFFAVPPRPVLLVDLCLG